MSKFFDKLVALCKEGKASGWKHGTRGPTCFFVFGSSEYHGIYEFHPAPRGGNPSINWKLGPMDNDSIAYQVTGNRTLGKAIASCQRTQDQWRRTNLLRTIRLARDEYAKYEGYSPEMTHLAQLLDPEDFAKLCNRHPDELQLIQEMVRSNFWRRLGARRRPRHARALAKAKSFKAYVKTHPLYRGIHPSVLNKMAQGVTGEARGAWENLGRYGRKPLMFATNHSNVRWGSGYGFGGETTWQYVAWQYKNPENSQVLADYVSAARRLDEEPAEITPYTHVEVVRGLHDRAEERLRLIAEARQRQWMERDKEYRDLLDANPWQPIEVNVPNVRTLITAQDYLNEGREMHHCINGHYQSTHKKVVPPKEGETKQTLQCIHRYGYAIRMPGGTKASAAFKHNPISGEVWFEQLRGPFNKAVDTQVQETCLELAIALGMKKEDVWTQIQSGYGSGGWW